MNNKHIQKLIESIEQENSNSIFVNGLEVMVTWNLFDIDLWHIIVDGNIIHSSKRNRIKKILKEWLCGERMLYDGILITL
jgi:hypothetical protein